MGKRYLLDETKNRYKANLHCHSTVSDGEMTPEKLKQRYMSQGYSIVAYTDHEILVPHPELNDSNFLALPGYEMQTFGDMELPKLMRRVNHMNFFPKDPENRRMPFFTRDDVMQLDRPPCLDDIEFDGDGNEKKEYSAAGLNRLIAKANKAGFLVSYNHPTWSKEDAGIYTNLKGLFAMEIYNHDSAVTGYDAYCPYVYEEMLRSGQHIGCIATDDTHSARDLFGGYTVILADSLAHANIISALEKGDYYASRGPEIKRLWCEDGVFNIECSPAKMIVASNSGRRRRSILCDENATLTFAQFPIQENDLYIRFTVTDAQGRTANTRAYWREEFTDEPAAIPDTCTRRIGAED